MCVLIIWGSLQNVDPRGRAPFVWAQRQSWYCYNFHLLYEMFFWLLFCLMPSFTALPHIFSFSIFISARCQMLHNIYPCWLFLKVATYPSSPTTPTVLTICTCSLHRAAPCGRLPRLYPSTSLPPELRWWILLMISLYYFFIIFLYIGISNTNVHNFACFETLYKWNKTVNCNLLLPVNIILRFICYCVQLEFYFQAIWYFTVQMSYYLFTLRLVDSWAV